MSGEHVDAGQFLGKLCVGEGMIEPMAVWYPTISGEPKGHLSVSSRRNRKRDGRIRQSLESW